VSNSRKNKARERRFVELFKSAYTDFPAGTILADESQERPDAIVVTPQGKMGIEITALHNDKLKRTESECEKAVLEAQQIYEKFHLPKLHVSVHIGGESSFSRKTRNKFATAIAKLVAANIPAVGKFTELENHFNNPTQFPYEINSIYIYRYSWPDENCWSAPSAGFYRENFIDELQNVIAEKDQKLSGYAPDCKEQWLLVVAENISPSTFFDPSQKTLDHLYKSAFDKIFLLEPFSAKLHELKLISNA
jgi:hypothetical protein